MQPFDLLKPDELYDQLKSKHISQRHKQFIIKALKEQGFKIQNPRKKYVQRNRGKAPFKPTDLPLIFKNMESLSVMMASLVGIATGARRAEITEILKKNIDFQECRIRLDITKKGIPQDVYFPKSFSHLLQKWIHCTPGSQYLFPNRLYQDRPLSPSSLNSELNKAVKKAGLAQVLYMKENGDSAQKYGFHSFRKFFCSMLVNNGVKPEVARILMRHEKIELTLKIYTQLGKRTLTDAMNQIDPLSMGNLTMGKEGLKMPQNPIDLQSQFAHQSLVLFNQYVNGTISQDVYEKCKQELQQIQKTYNAKRDEQLNYLG